MAEKFNKPEEDDEIVGNLIADLHDEQVEEEKPKKRFGFAKKEPKNSQFVQMDDISDDSMDSVVIVGQDNGELAKRSFFTSLKIILYVITGLIFMALVLFALMFKVIPTPVQGSTIESNQISIVPNSFQTNTSTISKGSIVILSDQPSYIPYLYKYTEYKVQKREGSVVYVTDKNGNQQIINVSNINYVK